MARRTRRSLAIFTVVLVLVLTVGATELALRLHDFPPRVAVSGWRATEPFRVRNELGFRGRPFAGAAKKRVLLVGDSQVENRLLGDDELPELALERQLARRGVTASVRSLGAAGYGPDQELLALEEYFLKGEADAVVLWETPGNDVWNALFPTHWPWNGSLKPTFRLDGAELRGPDARIEEVVTPSSALLRRAWWARERAAPSDDRWARSLPAPYAGVEAPPGASVESWDELATRDPRFRLETPWEEKSHYAILFAPRSARMEHALALARALTKRIGEVAAAHGARFLAFCAEPESHRTPDKLCSLRGKTYRLSWEQRQANLATWNEGLPWRYFLLEGSDLTVSKEDSHLNARGTDEAMSRVAEGLASELR